MTDTDPDLRPRPGEAPAPAGRPRSRWPWLILLLLIGGAILALAAWLDPATRARLEAAVQPSAVSVPAAQAPVPTAPVLSAETADLAALKARVADLEAELAARPAVPPPLNSPSQPAFAAQPVEARLAALEAEVAALRAAAAGTQARLDKLESGLAAATGAATRSDRQMLDLLLLAVGRRHVEQGRPLGRLADVFAARFRGVDGAAVEAIAAWSAAPQTRALLLARLDGLSLKPATAEPPADAGFWARLRDRLSGLVTVRDRAGSDTADPAALAAVHDALQAGDLPLAIARAERLPPGPGRDAWLADAALLASAERGLDRLETQLLADVAAREGAALAASGPAG